jgi:hypothetical protein
MKMQDMLLVTFFSYSFSYRLLVALPLGLVIRWQRGRPAKTSTILELARQYTQLPKPPRFLVAWTWSWKRTGSYALSRCRFCFLRVTPGCLYASACCTCVRGVSVFRTSCYPREGIGTRIMGLRSESEPEWLKERDISCCRFCLHPPEHTHLPQGLGLAAIPDVVGFPL